MKYWSFMAGGMVLAAILLPLLSVYLTISGQCMARPALGIFCIDPPPVPQRGDWWDR